MTVPEPQSPLFADRDVPDTEVITVSAPTPVFVDSTGRRRKVLRRLAYAFGVLCFLYGGLISVSLAGGPVSSSAVLPLPDLPRRAARPTLRPSSPPAPAAAPVQFAAGPLNPRGVDLGRTTRRTPTVIPAPARTPARTPATRTTSPPSRPLESATRTSTGASASPSPTPSTTPSKTPPASPAVPPPSPPSGVNPRSNAGPTPGRPA